MICPFCDNEIEDDRVEICPICGSRMGTVRMFPGRHVGIDEDDMTDDSSAHSRQVASYARHFTKGNEAVGDDTPDLKDIIPNEEKKAVRYRGKTKNGKKRLLVAGICLLVVLVLGVVLYLCGVFKKGSSYLRVDSKTGFFQMDTSLFGKTYDELVKLFGSSAVTSLADSEEDRSMQSCTIRIGENEFQCVMQNQLLIEVYYCYNVDSAKVPDNTFSAAKAKYGTDYETYTVEGRSDKRYIWKQCDSKANYIQYVKEKYMSYSFRQAYYSKMYDYNK